MILADWIVIIAVAVFALIGLLVGFGKTLKFFTSGIFGVLISVVVCYFLYGIVINWSITQTLLERFIAVLENADNTFCDILLKIHIETVVVCLAMFIVIQIIRILIVLLIKQFVEIKNPVFKFFNKLLGLVFMLCVAAVLLLIVFQIVAWIGGNTATDFAANLEGSFVHLDAIYENNPLNAMINYFTAE